MKTIETQGLSSELVFQSEDIRVTDQFVFQVFIQNKFYQFYILKKIINFIRFQGKNLKCAKRIISLCPKLKFIDLYISL